VFCLSTEALVTSFLSGLSCELFAFESIAGVPWKGLVPSLGGAIAAEVGLFTYRITESKNPAETNTE
jgi:hypothetical protein